MYRLLVDGTIVATSPLDVRSPSFARGPLTATPAYARLVVECAGVRFALADEAGWLLDGVSLCIERLRSTRALWLLAWGPMFDGPYPRMCPSTSFFEVTLTHCEIEGRFIASAPDLPEACGSGATAIAAMRRLRHAMGFALRDRHVRGARIRRREATRCARLVKLVVERAFSYGGSDPYQRHPYDVVAQALAARIAEATSADAGEQLAREVINDWLRGSVLQPNACNLRYLGAALAAIASTNTTTIAPAIDR